jgi:hypothetical protein
MPRWPKGHKKRTDRNYKQEAEWASSTEQKKRRADRNRARNEAIKKGKVRRGDGKELDHVGSHPHGRLKNVPTKVVSRSANRRRQPKNKG